MRNSTMCPHERPQIDLSALRHRSTGEQTLWNALIARTRANDRSAVMQSPLPRVQFDRLASQRSICHESRFESIRTHSKLRRLTVNLPFHRVNWITKFAWVPSSANIHLYPLPRALFVAVQKRSTYLFCELSNRVLPRSA